MIEILPSLVQNTPLPEKRYNTKEFADVTSLSVRTIENLRSKRNGRLLPAGYDEKGRAYYTDAQIEVAKQFCRHTKKLPPVDNVVPLFDNLTNEIVTANDDREDDGSNDDDEDVEEIIATVSPVDNSDDLQNATADDILQKSAESADSRREEKAAPIEILPCAGKNFLPMSITPNFDAIPQIMKDLPRWLVWRLIPADPKPKKVPMTPKNGKLVNAAVNKSENWLTFDEAISWYNRGLCSGIGFALTNQKPKVCCIDVDHCFNPDGSLTDEAKAVIDTCQNPFTEKSQSGDGIHNWFIDEEFNGGRRKGNVEVYAADRYIAVTGNHIESTAVKLLTVNGACSKVIAKFIDVREENLFEAKPARATDEKINIDVSFETNLPMTDDDCRLIDYFHSDKCQNRDLNMFNLFRGNVAEYFKNTGKPVDDSVADEHLILKILYYIGGAGKDAEIGQRALKLFNQSGLAKREKWQSRADYQLRTLKSAFKIWVDGGRKAIKPESNSRHEENKDNPIDALKTELCAVNKSIADFVAEKSAALEKLRNVDTFDSETVFSDDIVVGAAFARLFDRQAYSDLKREIKLYGDKHKDKKAAVNDWVADVKDKAIEIENKHSALVSRRNSIQAQINSLSFVATNDDILADIKIPLEYSVSKSGIEKVAGEGSITVCRRPVIISGKSFDVEEKNFKLSLTYMTDSGIWKTLPSVEADIPADSRKIVSLAKKGLPVTSVNALQLVDYLDAFHALNENTLPFTYFVNRCGWHHFSGKDYFIDPRRDCVIQDDDKNISVKVDEGRSEFAKHLKPVGSIEAWKKVYKLAKKYPVARSIVAASVAPILLKVLGERNFLLYIYAPTRAGKTTALLLGASTIGDEKIVRSFDATKNGLAGAAADVNDYPFLIDEKQVADNRLKDAFDNLIYALANGIGRTKLNKDSTLKKTQDWRTIAIMTGETEMLSDNVTGGAYTRLLTIKAPAEILPADVCKIIRDTIKENCGLVLPLVVDKVKELGEENLRGVFKEMVDTFEERFSEILPEYRRYMAILTLADTILNAATFGNTITTDDGKTIKASDDAIINTAKIFPLIPTVAEISDTAREKDFVRGLVAQNQNRFIGGNVPLERMQAIWGTIEDKIYIYITARALKDACKNEGYDYRKLVADLVTDKFIIPSTKIKKGCKKPLDTVQRKIGKTNADCYRISRSIFESVSDNE